MSLTDEQATALYQSRYEQLVAPTSSERVQLARQQYERLVEAGWTIEPPPEPRYVVKEFGEGTVLVNDTRHNIPVRQFSVKSEIEPRDDTVAAAQAEADRLNGGAA